MKPPVGQDIALYRQTLNRRHLAEQRALTQRLGNAWALAKQAASLLKAEFGAQQVAVFGSLVHGQWFSQTSDVDLAVWGLNPERYLIAVARLQDLSSDFKVDLVLADRCSPSLAQAIFQEGKIL